MKNSPLLYFEILKNKIVRRLILISLDLFLICISITISSYFIFNGAIEPSSNELKWIYITISIITLPILYFSGQYKPLTQFNEINAIYPIITRSFCIVNLTFLLGYILRFELPEYKFFILIFILFSILSSLFRHITKDILKKLYIISTSGIKRVAIYGAGIAGVQLLGALSLSKTHRIIYFVDDSPSLYKRNLNGVPIISPNQLQKRASSIDQILLAIPSLTKSRRKSILKKLQKIGIPILQVPSISKLATGNETINSLQNISVEELLGRDPVPFEDGSINTEFEGSNICITGAGGSIGSDLCRKIIDLKPKSIILLELSEPNLYEIYSELIKLNIYNIEIIPLLANATESFIIENIFEKYNINIVLHAAAYKHVPLVETNPITGIYNNAKSSYVICKASIKYSVKKVILISSDKAVRPTNIMGASKRLCEIIFQSFADNENTNNKDNKTIFAMVRFGNVLGSSGSVVPLFNQQIDQGGPITLTHPEIVRYFMTINEASRLVIQAALQAKGGEVFLLDMGEPVLIKDLALQMINLRGLKVKDKLNKNGDIELKITGLRSGEKLYEELLIDSKSTPTKHPLIYQASEPFIKLEKLTPKLEALEEQIKNSNTKQLLKLLHEIVPEWKNKYN